VCNEFLDLLASSIAKRLYTAELRREGLNSRGIELMLANELAEVIAHSTPPMFPLPLPAACGTFVDEGAAIGCPENVAISSTEQIPIP
jgi:hypothetical protein